MYGPKLDRILEELDLARSMDSPKNILWGDVYSLFMMHMQGDDLSDKEKFILVGMMFTKDYPVIFRNIIYTKISTDEDIVDLFERNNAELKIPQAVIDHIQESIEEYTAYVDFLDQVYRNRMELRASRDRLSSIYKQAREAKKRKKEED